MHIRLDQKIRKDVVRNEFGENLHKRILHAAAVRHLDLAGLVEKALELENVLALHRLCEIKAEVEVAQRVAFGGYDVVHLSLARDEQVALFHAVRLRVHIKCAAARKHAGDLVNRLLVLKGLVARLTAQIPDLVEDVRAVQHVHAGVGIVKMKFRSIHRHCINSSMRIHPNYNEWMPRCI